MTSDRTKGIRIKLCQGWMGYQEKVLHGEMVIHWNRLSRKMTPSLSEFKECMDAALNHML